MRGWKDGYLTRAALTTQIRTVVARDHNLDRADVVVNWLSKWELVTFPTKLVAKTGKIKVRAPGFEPRTYCVYQEKNSKWYMR